jgi:hypothetical protein
MFQMEPSWQQIQSQVWSMSQRCAGREQPGAMQVRSRAYDKPADATPAAPDFNR